MSDEYLDLLEKKLDPIQKECCCSKGNTLVAAGAGSGKTQVLATRFAWLVMSENIPVSQILTLTFTKKAAGEMYERIYKTLHFFANNPNTPEKEKQRAALALQNFSEAHIQTLDSYCSSIVKQAATKIGIRPDFNSGTSDSTKTINDMALKYIFQHKESLAIKNFSSPGKFQDFAESILGKIIQNYTTLATEKNFFTTNTKKQTELIFKIFNFFILGKDTTNEENNLLFKTYFPDIQEHMTSNNLCVCKSIPDVIDQLIQERESINDYKGESQLYTVIGSKREQFEQISDNLKKYSSYTLNQDTLTEIIPNIKKELEHLKSLLSFSGKGKCAEQLTNLKEYRNAIIKIYLDYSSSCIKFVEDSKAFFNLSELIDELTQQVNDSKRETGNLTFSDVSELALKVLKEDKEILKQEQNSYRRIMIDEFQDNNGKNRDLLFLLCGDEQKLFFVGDEKQSIYKFRGADVSVFNTLKDDKKINKPTSMIYNYRSTLAMISAFNILFKKNEYLFNNDTTNSYEATYKEEARKYNPETKQVLPELTLTPSNVPIHVCLLKNEIIAENKKTILSDPKDELLDSKDQICYFIAKKIKELKESDKKINYSDFAILDYSRINRTYLIKWLNNFNIPYSLDQSSSLFSDGPINDIYNYLRLCVYPNDKNAYAGYLSSPFCGKNFSSVVDELTENSSFIIPERKTILSQKITTTLTNLWYKTGYYYETLLNNNTYLYAEQFDFIFEMARQCEENENSLSWFVDQLSIIKQNETSSFKDEVELNEKDISYPLEKEDAVQIMTIHKSKGLQFKHVFIYSLLNKKESGNRDNCYFDNNFGLSYSFDGSSSNFFYKIASKQEKLKNIAEFRRLIYVAITRAIENVYIVDIWKNLSKKEMSDINNYLFFKKYILKLYADKIDENNGDYTIPVYVENAPFDYWNIKPETKYNAYSIIEKNNSENHFPQIFNNYQNKPVVFLEELISNRKTPSSLEITKKETEIFDSDSGEKFEKETDTLYTGEFTAADFGTLVHAYLEGQANNILPQNFIPEQRLFKNLTEQEINSKKSECIKMCSDFKNSEIGKRFENAKTQNRFYKAEYGFRMYLNDTFFTGSIDLIFQNEDGSYTIVDYKSDNEINPEKYRPQQDCYKTAASKLLEVEEEKISCSLFYLKHNKEIIL